VSGLIQPMNAVLPGIQNGQIFWSEGEMFDQIRLADLGWDGGE
jgi:hypothetical protein